MIVRLSLYLYIFVPLTLTVCSYGYLVPCVSVNMVVTRYGSQTTFISYMLLFRLSSFRITGLALSLQFRYWNDS